MLFVRYDSRNNLAQRHRKFHFWKFAQDIHLSSIFTLAPSAFMLPYTTTPQHYLGENQHRVASFLRKDEKNIDWKTVRSFGEEWKKFNSMPSGEIERIANDYFDIADDTMLHHDALALDVGCGGGRWAQYIAPKVKFVEAIEPSQAALSASHYLNSTTNVRVTQASVEEMPFADNSFDFVYSLGVLHHVPNTQEAIQSCFEKVKPGGWFLLYLYYNLDNRNFLYKMIFQASDLLRRIVSALPGRIKRPVCDILTVLVYFPLVNLSRVLSLFSLPLANAIPLAYYRKTSFQVWRNDSLDRFGTPLEKRFSKGEIHQMLVTSGFSNLHFSQKPPYWHVIAQKK